MVSQRPITCARTSAREQQKADQIPKRGPGFWMAQVQKPTGRGPCLAARTSWSKPPACCRTSWNIDLCGTCPASHKGHISQGAKMLNMVHGEQGTRDQSLIKTSCLVKDHNPLRERKTGGGSAVLVLESDLFKSRRVEPGVCSVEITPTGSVSFSSVYITPGGSCFAFRIHASGPSCLLFSNHALGLRV